MANHGGYGNGGASSSAPFVQSWYAPPQTLTSAAPPPMTASRTRHSCPYCSNGTSVILQNMPFEAARCDIAVHQTLDMFGAVRFTECVGDGQAIATFAEHHAAVNAVQCMAATVYAVAMLDCTLRSERLEMMQ